MVRYRRLGHLRQQTLIYSLQSWTVEGQFEASAGLGSPRSLPSGRGASFLASSGLW